MWFIIFLAAITIFWTVMIATGRREDYPDISETDGEMDSESELADSPEAMLKTVEAARLERQREIDEEMKDNKI